MATPELRVGSAADGTLALSGPLLFTTAAAALDQAETQLASGAWSELDLAGLSAVDSAGLACVLAILAAGRRRGLRLQVTHLPESLMALAKVCEADQLLARGASE